MLCCIRRLEREDKKLSSVKSTWSPGYTGLFMLGKLITVSIIIVHFEAYMLGFNKELRALGREE